MNIMKTIKAKCGGKSSGCAVEFDLPKGITPHRISDRSKEQSEAGTKQTSK